MQRSVGCTPPTPTFSCRTELPLSEILSSCRSDELYVNSFLVVTTYVMEQRAQSIQWTQGSFMPFLGCHFPRNTKRSVLML